MSTFLRTTESYQAGARTMPREYYASPEVFAREREQVFARQWICVGRTTDFAEPGSYRLADIGGESLIVVRDRAGEIRAHYNVCRHRGTRLCTEVSGTLSETIQCPYHAWTYRLDGRLIGAPHMAGTPGFSVGDYPLHSAAVGQWYGFVLVNLGAKPEPFEHGFAPLI
jgi:Rieske 2Fe-2S family protein